MILQEFKSGQKVISSKGSKPLNYIVYTVITADPVYQKFPLIKRIGFIFRSQKPQKIIVNYIYRCKSAVDMKDFPQDELLPYKFLQA
jgi:hypothetical protein